MKLRIAGPLVIIMPQGHVNEYSNEAHAELCALIEQVDKIKHRAGPLVLANLSETLSMNSSGLGNLVTALASANWRGGRFALCEVSPRVDMLLDMTKLKELFEIFPTQSDALAAFGITDNAVTQ
jgi:anti-anti-sigma factor